MSTNLKKGETRTPEELLHDIHRGLKSIDDSLSTHRLVRGTYAYYHYMCDDIDDRGWGCGYRTMQTICSWIYYQKRNNNENTIKTKLRVPSISEIQHALVTMGDKSESFLDSREWIGSVEISMCLDYFYDVSCRLVHIPAGKLSDNIACIFDHFENIGSPLMMGGDTDNSSKGIFGIIKGSNDRTTYLLVIDPHYTAKHAKMEHLINEKWVSWRSLDSFDESSFYNLCFPLLVNS